MNEKAKAGDPAFELVLTKSPMAGVTEQKVEQKVVQAKPTPQNPPVEAKAPQVKPQTQPVVQPGFEHIANIPTIFCADREIAKGLLVDLFAMIGTMEAIETGNVNAETLPVVLQNTQRILTNMSDIMIRDCGVTDADLDEVANVFKDVSAEAARQVMAKPAAQPSAAVRKPEVPEQPKKEQPTAKVGSNVL